MDMFVISEKLKAELEKGQTVKNLVDYIMCIPDVMNTIITKHYGMRINTNPSTKRRLIREYVEELV